MILDLQFIRHGKTEASVNSIYCGSTDIPLCAEGIADITAYAAEGIYRNDSLLFSSAMKRPQQTLKIIFGENADYETLPQLNEMHFGDFEMHKYDELLENKQFTAWLEDKSGDYVCPQGESVNMFLKRVETGYRHIYGYMADKKIKQATVVSHGGTIGFYLNSFLKTGNVYSIMPKPGLGYIVTLDFDGGKVEIKNLSRIESKK